MVVPSLSWGLSEINGFGSEEFSAKLRSMQQLRRSVSLFGKNINGNLREQCVQRRTESYVTFLEREYCFSCCFCSSGDIMAFIWGFIVWNIVWALWAKVKIPFTERMKRPYLVDLRGSLTGVCGMSPRRLLFHGNPKTPENSALSFEGVE